MATLPSPAAFGNAAETCERLALCHWQPGQPAYLWTECGIGDLLLVTRVDRDWWARAGGAGWACCPTTLLYLCPSEADRLAVESALRARLDARRINWRAI